MVSSKTRVGIAVAVAGLAIVGLLAFRTFKPRGEDTIETALLPAGSYEGFVDSRTCASCHQKIWETYRQTGMGRSFALARPEVIEPNLSGKNSFHHAASDRYYEILKKDANYYQRRHQRGFDGREENIVEKQIHYVVGSGNHARTYLHKTSEGRLFELPLAWYSENGGHWAMNPGFDSARHPDFRRQILYECISCHTGYPEIKAASDRSGSEPLFPGRIPDGIDCQRCHGPGQKHVEAASSGEPEAARVAIVNPKRLTPERQLEVCMQCHLETTSSRLPHTILNFDRGAFSYRPGTPLANFAIHFDHQPGSGRDDKFEIAHQAYRLRQSPCFQKSKGQMTCTTCHDPHLALRGEEATRHYNNTCGNCHKPHGADPNCIACHMPKRRPEDVVNVVMTDHYIRRRPALTDLKVIPPERNETQEAMYRGPVVLYYPNDLPANSTADLYLALAQVKQLNNLDAGIPRLAAALERNPTAAGEFYFELAEAYVAAGKSEDAIPSYREAIRRKPEYRPAWAGLGRALTRSGQSAEAIQALEKAAGMGVESATILNDVGLALLSAERRNDAIHAFQRAVAADPDHPEAHFNLAGALQESGNAADAERFYRNALRTQPDFSAARMGLANLLSARGNHAEADFHYGKVLAEEPKSAKFRVEYGTALAAREEYGPALVQFTVAAKLDPRMAEAQLGLADLLALRGDMASAAESYRRALALNSNLSAAHLGLASILRAQGRQAEAVAHFEKAAQGTDTTVVEAAREALQSFPRTGASHSTASGATDRTK